MRTLVIGASRCSQMLRTFLNCEVDFVDDNEVLWGGNVLSIHTDDILSVIDNYDFAHIGVAVHNAMPFRKKIYEILKNKIPLINIIHPSANVANTARIGEGNYIGANSYVAPFCIIGDCNFFSAGTILEHHSTVGNLNSWGPSNSIAGGCIVGDEVCFGTNVGVIWDISIGSRSRLASGVCLHTSVKEGSIVRKKFFPDAEAVTYTKKGKV